ncbi:hypothetical protein HRbin32_01269 [bacterium HR32]|nr:hypothetical protein HRbin32_01269 [bacterium HR32]
MLHGPADPEVVEGSTGVVHPHGDLRGGGPDHHLEVRVPLEGERVLRHHPVAQDVHVTRPQGRQLRVLVGEDPEGDLVQVREPPDGVGGVALEPDRHPALPPREPEGAGAHGLRALFLHASAGTDHRVGPRQVEQELGVGLPEPEDHGVGVGCLHPHDVPVVLRVGVAGPRVPGPLELEQDVLRGEAGAVVEGHVPPQVEGVREPSGRNGPAFREGRDDLALRVELHQPLQDVVVQHPGDLLGRRRGGVQHRRLRVDGHRQATARAGRLGSRQACCEQHCHEHQP